MSFDWHALIVEDIADNAEVVEAVLSHNGISFTTVTSAEAALEILGQHQPTVILVDLALPGMNGWELLQILRETPATANLPIVAITAFHSTRVAEEAIQAGFDAYFPKPINTLAFVPELQRIVG